MYYFRAWLSSPKIQYFIVINRRVDIREKVHRPNTRHLKGGITLMHLTTFCCCLCNNSSNTSQSVWQVGRNKFDYFYCVGVRSGVCPGRLQSKLLCMVG